MPRHDRDALEFRRSLRRFATDAEKRLWWALRNGHLGVKFRRQHSIGPYVLDFYCAERKLAVELDGGQHRLPAEMERDARRTAYLESKGIRVIRFSNYDALGDGDVAVRAIWRALGAEESPRSFER